MSTEKWDPFVESVYLYLVYHTHSDGIETKYVPHIIFTFYLPLKNKQTLADLLGTIEPKIKGNHVSM